MLACSYSSQCSGCDWLLKPEAEQRDLKINSLRQAWAAAVGSASDSSDLPEIRFVSIAGGGLRDRTDLMIDRRGLSPRLGLFNRFQTGLVYLEGCPQLSPRLEHWLQDFRKIEIPVERGSLRLRVAPDGRRGVWLDLANVDIKRLLDERTLLSRLNELATIEIGQKRKRLIEREGRLKLGEPELEPWFETYLEDGRVIPLYCAIGSFTQPGFRANHALVAEVRSQVTGIQAQRALEFGAGIGNFTLPLASICESVDVFEVDALALEGLDRSLRAAGASEKVTIHSGNFQISRAASVDFSGADLIFVDPPRSGLMGFLDPLVEIDRAQRPPHFIYVSCFTESFARDSMRLRELGYHPVACAIVDQFPQSRHFEIVARFDHYSV